MDDEVVRPLSKRQIYCLPKPVEKKPKKQIVASPLQAGKSLSLNLAVQAQVIKDVGDSLFTSMIKSFNSCAMPSLFGDAISKGQNKYMDESAVLAAPQDVTPWCSTFVGYHDPNLHEVTFDEMKESINKIKDELWQTKK